MGKAQVRDSGDEKDSFVDELKPGTKLMHGQYTIENFLNAGGFGITYLAKDSLDRKIVIKECFPGAFCRRSRYVVQARSRAHQNELKSIVRLFVQEARSLAKLDHPNIVGVHQVFEDNETAYMALDFVEGRDLLDTIEDPNHGLTPPQIKLILKEVLGAVGFIHDQGILHRDISPDNILINKNFHPVLIDFGAAREEATKQSRVLSALRVVKDGYSPQEFYIAGSDQSPSSDLYALAASFHHLIAKDVPPNSQARLAAIASGDPDPYEPLLGRFEEYDNDFLAAIDKALAVLPKDRLQSAQDWVNMMDGVEGNVTALNVVNTGAVASEEAPAAEGGQKSKMPLLLGSAAAVALLVGVGVFMTTGGDDPVVAVAPTATVEAPDTPVEVNTASVAPVEAAPTPVAPEPVVTAPEVAEPTPEATEPAVPEQPAPEIVANTENATPPAPTPVIVQPPAPVIVDAAEPESTQEAEPRPVIVAAPAVTEVPTPVVRPAVRPESIEIAAVPVVEAPAPLPEPVATPRPAASEPAANAELPSQSGNRPVADGATPSVALPGSPSTVAALGTGAGIEGIAAVVPGNELAPPSVASSWSVQLPFSPAGEGSNAVGDIAFISPVWVKQGLEITAVNGTPVAAIADISGVLRNTTAPGEADQVEVVFGTQDPATGTAADHSWILPVVQETTLLNGVRFETVFAGTEWRTTVAEVPEGLTGDLQVGDVMKAYIPESEEITGRDTLANIIERELDNGAEQFAFDVQRGEGRWLAVFNYSGGED